MKVHARFLTTDEARRVSLAPLREYFSRFGFTEATVSEDETYDGAPVFRIVANVEQTVPTETFVDALSAIHNALRKEGEERLVFLSTSLPSSRGASTAFESEED
ncbi:MAG TPA: hypothetical protein PKE65_09755 [Rhizobiaceae bacterium]|nr:hypothetical protein [Rhizobiaceae bacterium]